MAGTPLRKLFPKGLCQAKNRRGLPCGVRLDVRRCKNGRPLCKWHGGWSTGPRTAEGKARCGEVGRRNLKAWHALRKGYARIQRRIARTPVRRTSTGAGLDARSRHHYGGLEKGSNWPPITRVTLYRFPHARCSTPRTTCC